MLPGIAAAPALVRIPPPVITGVVAHSGLPPIPYAGSVDVSGTAIPGATVTIYVGGISAGTTTADGSGVWLKTSVSLSYGANNITATQSGSVPSVATPVTYDGWTKTLLHFDNNLTDVIGRAWTQGGGNTAFSSTTKKFGTHSLQLGSSVGYLQANDSVDFTVGMNDLTIDFWLYLPADISGLSTMFQYMLWGQCASDQKNSSIVCITGRDSGGFYLTGLEWTPDATASVFGASTWDAFNLGAWNHCALVRSGNYIEWFLNGVLSTNGNAVKPCSVPFYDSANKWGINCLGEYTSNRIPISTMFLDEFRFSNGIARWASNFTPPAAPY